MCSRSLLVQVLLQLVAENNIVMTDIINKLGVHERFDIAWKHANYGGCCLLLPPPCFLSAPNATKAAPAHLVWADGRSAEPPRPACSTLVISAGRVRLSLRTELLRAAAVPQTSCCTTTRCEARCCVATTAPVQKRTPAFI